MYPVTNCSSVVQNLLLCALPPAEAEHLLPHLEPVRFSPGEIVYEPGERIGYCDFPTNALVSLVFTMRDGTTAETDHPPNDHDSPSLSGERPDSGPWTR